MNKYKLLEEVFSKLDSKDDLPIWRDLNKIFPEDLHTIACLSLLIYNFLNLENKEFKLKYYVKDDKIFITKKVKEWSSNLYMSPRIANKCFKKLIKKDLITLIKKQKNNERYLDISLNFKRLVELMEEHNV